MAKTQPKGRSGIATMFAKSLYPYAKSAYTKKAISNRALNKFGTYDSIAKKLVQPTGDDLANMTDYITEQEKIAAMGTGGVPATGMGALNIAMNAAKAHPYAAMGLGTLGAMNIGGLTDNDKFGGQLGGAALGGLGATLAQDNPALQAALVMGGGSLGSLFDKLRAKKEQEQLQEQRYGGR